MLKKTFRPRSLGNPVRYRSLPTVFLRAALKKFILTSCFKQSVIQTLYADMLDLCHDAIQFISYERFILVYVLFYDVVLSDLRFLEPFRPSHRGFGFVYFSYWMTVSSEEHMFLIEMLRPYSPLCRVVPRARGVYFVE